MRYIYIYLALLLFSCDHRIHEEKLPSASLDRVEFLNRTISELSSALNEESTDEDLILLGNYLSQSGWPSQSEKWSKMAVGPHRESAMLSTQLGQYYFSIGEYQLAQEYTATANLLGAKSVDYYQLQAELSNYNKEYEKALDYVNQAILINQSDYYLYQTKADIYLTVGDTVSGIEFLKRGLELQPRLLDIGDRLVGLYVDQGQTDKAINLIRRMQTFHPENESLIWQEAQYYLINDSILPAKRLLISAINEDSNRYELKRRLADLYFDIGEVDSALILSENLLRHDSTQIEQHIRLGVIYDKKNFLNKSLSAYTNALAIDSTSDIAIQGQAKVLRKLAYLRALRETKEQLPSFEILTPKKN